MGTVGTNPDEPRIRASGRPARSPRGAGWRWRPRLRIPAAMRRPCSRPRARPPASLTRGDRHRPVARRRRGLGGLAATGAVARPAGRHRGRDPSDRLLDVDAETVGIRMHAAVDLDVTAFEACLAKPDHAEAAIALYLNGDLLEGLGHDCSTPSGNGCPTATRMPWRASPSSGSRPAIRLAAQVIAEQLLARDPLREEAHAVVTAVHARWARARRSCASTVAARRARSWS